jgi:hypothetical protein
MLEFERIDENRVYRDSLHFNIQNLDVFPKQAQEYFNDNFSFRSPLLHAYHAYKFKLFNISPHPEKTIIGSNGWFYITQKELKIYEGNQEFSESQLNRFDQLWIDRKVFLDSLKIKSYWMIAPMKHYVYSEFLPFNIIKKEGDSRVETLTKRIENRFPGFIIDPLPRLLSKKDSVDVFLKLDNHWNRTAGYEVANLILETIHTDFPEINPVNYTDYTWVDSSYSSGYHKNVLGIPELLEQEYFPFHKNEKAPASSSYNFPVTEGFMYTGEFEKVFKNNNSINGLTLLVIRDSFGNFVMPFLKEPFQERSLI